MNSPSRWPLLGALLVALLLVPTFACEPEPVPVGPDATLAGPDAALAGPDATLAGPDAAQAGPDAAQAGPDAEAMAPDAALAGPDAEAMPPDAAQASPDAEAMLPDAGSAALPGFGTLTGECGVLDTELTDSDPHFVVNTLDFGTDAYDATDLSKLTTGGQKIATSPNAGGSSIMSETFAFEALARCELASLLKIETEIIYTTPGKITDELVEIDGLKIGVSVVRAMTYPRTNPYTEALAKSTLEKKLQGILDSTQNVAPEDKWKKQILHVLADTQQHADVLRTVWEKTSATLRADTVVVVTVTNGADDPIYTN